MTFTAAQLHALLSHSDAQVRSLADWTREYRGFGTRGLSGDRYSVDAQRMEKRLTERLAALDGKIPIDMWLLSRTDKSLNDYVFGRCSHDTY